MSDFSIAGSQFDPLAALDEGSGAVGAKSERQQIHLRLQKRSGKKSLTTIQGLDEKYCDKLLDKLRKKLHCSGSVIKHKEFGKIIQIQGDHREAVVKELVSRKLAKEGDIKVHGY